MTQRKTKPFQVAMKKIYLGKLFCPFRNATEKVRFLLKPGNWQVQFFEPQWARFGSEQGKWRTLWGHENYNFYFHYFVL